ncbi:MAG: DUF5684 domain-containing protein [Planctomycetaceae bacterium]
MVGQSNQPADGGAAVLFLVLFVAIWILAGVAYYGIFKKASRPAWGAFVPIYNLVLLLEVVGRPVWWVLLFFIPIVNVVIVILVYNDLSKSFGKGVGFTLGLIFLSWIFLMILSFGSATYRGPAAATAMPGSPIVPPPPPPMPV